MPERMTDGELFLNAIWNISTWDERPAAISDFTGLPAEAVAAL